MKTGWDWPLLFYIGTVVLKMPEERFWRTTPRALKALIDTHVYLNTDSDNPKRQKTGYIDEIPL